MVRPWRGRRWSLSIFTEGSFNMDNMDGSAAASRPADPAPFDKNKNTIQRLMYSQTLLNKQLIMQRLCAMADNYIF